MYAGSIAHVCDSARLDSTVSARALSATPCHVRYYFDWQLLTLPLVNTDLLLVKSPLAFINSDQSLVNLELIIRYHWFIPGITPYCGLTLSCNALSLADSTNM